jgi:hypothetical protein
MVPTDPQTDHVDTHRRSDRGGRYTHWFLATCSAMAVWSSGTKVPDGHGVDPFDSGCPGRPPDPCAVRRRAGTSAHHTMLIDGISGPRYASPFHNLTKIGALTT